MDEYIKSLYPESYTILGVELNHGLTLGQLLILQRLEAFPAESNDDLFMCVMVCSSDDYTLDSLLNDKWLPLKIRIWRWQLGEPDWLSAHTLWNEFLAEHMHVPLFKKLVDGESERSATPFLQSLKITLMSKLNMSLDDVLRTQFNEAVWLYLGYWEQEGALVIQDRDERKRLKELADKYQQELNAKGNNNGS